MRIVLIFAVMVGTLVSAQAQQDGQLRRGALVQVKPATNPDGTVNGLILSVVAVPGDRLRVDPTTSSVFVNDHRIGGFTPDFLARVAARPDRIPATVPAGQYFLMGEADNGRAVKEQWGQYAASSLIRIRS